MTALIPSHILESCSSMNYDFSELSFETVVNNICEDIGRVIEWSFAACTRKERVQSEAGGRAASFKRKTGNICRRIRNRIEKDL